MAERHIELDVSGEHDLYVLYTALEYIRKEFLGLSEDPTEATGEPFLQWAAAADNMRLQVQEH